MEKTRICLIGIDGSGKTTHLTALLQEFRQNDLRCKYINLRGEYFRFLSLPTLFFFRLIGREKKFVFGDRVYFSRHPMLGPKSSLLTQLWSLLFLLDLLVLALLRGYFSVRPDIILCDRCVIDALVDLMVALGKLDLYRGHTARPFLRILTPEITLLLDVDETQALMRGRDKLDLDYLKLRRPLYLRIASELRLFTIYSGKDFLSVHREITRYIMKSTRLLKG